MNIPYQHSARQRGMTLMEIMIAVIVITISVVAFVTWQRATWGQTATTNRTIVAGHIIEKQIERRRMIIARNPAANYAAFKNLTDTTITDNSVKPSVKVHWAIGPAHDPTGAAIANVRTVRLTASWGSTKNDTLRVTTCIARDF